MQEDRIREIENTLGYQFKDPSLLKLALTHRSYDRQENNERLEFLGDAVLDLVVGDYLYKEFPEKREGELSKLRAALVNEQSFMRLALALRMDAFLILSVNEENNGGRKKPSLLSSAFEALIGAVYLEAGFSRAYKIAKRILVRIYPKIDYEYLSLDYKTLLQEYTQATYGQIPEYRVISESGPDHCKVFEVGIFILNEELARCVGSSKKSAQQSCAKKVFDKLGVGKERDE